jgi:hypothetical protein
VEHGTAAAVVVYCNLEKVSSMKLKRITAAVGVVCAAAMGSMLFTGPAAQAATAAPAFVCEQYIEQGLTDLAELGLQTPSDPTWQNVYNYIIFDTNLMPDTEGRAALLRDAFYIGYYCQ